MERALRARAEPGEPAQLSACGVVGLDARVFGRVRPRGRPRRPVLRIVAKHSSHWAAPWLVFDYLRAFLVENWAKFNARRPELASGM